MAEPSDPTDASDKKPAKAASDSKKPEKNGDSPAKAETDAKSARPAKADDKSAGKKDADKPVSGGKSSSVPGAGRGKPAGSQAKSEKSGGGGVFLVLLAVVILLGGGGYVTRDLWLPEVEPYLAKLPGFGASGEKATDEGQPSPVELLSRRIASLEKTLAENGGADRAMAALKEERARVQAELNKALARIDDLEGRLAEVRELASAVTSNSGAEVDLTPIFNRIDGLEKQDRETSGEVRSLSEKVEDIASKGAGAAGSGVVLAVAQLRDAVLSGRPYAAQLSALKSVAAGNTEIVAAASRLDSASERGLPTVETLQAGFSDIAGDIVAQARAGSGDWLDQATGRLSALVALRRTDGASGNPVEDAVARIEQDLTRRDVASAAKTAAVLADTVEGEARTLLEPWLLDAKARATAERALDAMHASALAALEG